MENFTYKHLQISAICLLLSFLFAPSLQSQTVHISPTGNGGFESGTTFAANGWEHYSPGSSTQNQWTLGTGAGGYTGSAAAYITNNTAATPPPNSYTNSSWVNHIYRNVTIPVANTQIQLSFKWKCYGESSYDRMRVWLVPTSYSPTNGVEISSSGSAPNGYVQVGLINYSQSSSWSNELITIPSAYAGTTFRLVLEWRNDGSVVNYDPIAIDDISLTSQPLTSYCAAGGTNSGRYINNFSTTGGTTNINNATGYSAGGYGNFTSQAVVAAPGTTINFNTSFTGSTYRFKIWVDWNNNYAFEATEVMFGPSSYVSTLNGSFVIPATVSGGSYRMRIRILYLGADMLACGSDDQGEVEDYTVTVQSLPCSTAPSSTNVTAITTTSSNLNWTAASPAPASGYTYYYSTNTTAPSFASTGSGNTTATSVLLSPLLSGTQYYAWVRSNCGGTNGMGAWIGPFAFTTLITNNECTNALTAPVNSTTACTNSISGTTVGATQSLAGCTGTADDDVWYKFVATSSSHTITVSTGTIRDIVFQVLSNCSASNSLACIDNTVGTSAETTTLNSLIVGSTYYIRIYSYSNGSNQGTFTLCITTPEPPCTSGTGMGTSNACVSTIAGGLGLSGAPAPAVTCSSGIGCVTLEANYLQLGQTTNYTVSSIPYAPPYQFSCLANTVDATVDDVWSPRVNLPFNFCFYGNTYSQVLISSNGVISFDTTNNVPGGSSTWSFDSNLPSTNLFRNSIFGVYHDINPSIGGTIGWELIELNSGCRALVAAWSDVPMFGSLCGDLNYTGMVVLYENTNIIEIYVKEKNVCSSWNDGNAIIGIQNGAGTQAVVPPNRNGLSPDWTTSNEAWRFTPSGTSITTVNWYQGATATGTSIGTGNTITVCPENTTQYTAEVTYNLCGGGTLTSAATTTVTINTKSKTWNGSAGSDWNNPNNWTPPGVPSDINCVIIPTTTNPALITSAASAYSVELTNAGKLTIEENHSLQIENELKVNSAADFKINNNGSLVQVNAVTNTGIMKMERKTQPMYRYDYTYWNSPVTDASGFTLGNLSPLTLSDKYFKWQPHFSGGHGNWVQQSPGTTMLRSNGYIVRAPQTFSTSPAAATKLVYTATFVGTPNNGNIIMPVSRGTMSASTANDKWNLIGNPYPSAVSAASLLSSNSAVVDGTIYLWTHNSAISAEYPDPFYGDFVYNYSGADYAVWNTFGATAATSGGELPNGFIPAGASFFIKSKVAAGSVTFNNAMRVRDYNNQFFKSGTDTFNEGESTFEKHRIWLNMMNSSSLFSQIVVGYSEGATLNYDSGLDAERLASATTAFYSTIEDYNLAIQARPLPFDVADVVPLGYITDVNDEFSIRIHETDPLFENYEIILEDKSLNVFHNLKMSPYFFTTATGRYNDRFALRFMDNLLGVDAPQQNAMLSAFVKNDFLNVKCSNPIENIIIYDVTGKLIKTINPDASMTEHRWQFPFAQGAYFAKFTMSDGKETTRKLMH